MIKEYWEKITANVVDIIEKLTFNGTDVLTSTHTSGRGLQIKNVADPTDQQDVVTLAYLETQQGGAAVTKVNLELPVAGNVTIDLDSVAQQGNQSTVDLEVPEEVYGVLWASSPEVPTKKDLYTKIETLVVKEEGKTLMDETQAAKLANSASAYAIHMPAGSSVGARIAALTADDFPEGWVLTVGASPVDLVITHNLARRVMNVAIFALDGVQEQQLFNTAAFNGIITPNENSLRIQSLATVLKDLKVYILFV